MNQGLKVASGDVLVIMNPDVKLGKGVDRMYAYLMQNDSIGVIAPQIKNVQGVIQDSFRRFITPMNFVCRHLHRMLGMERVEIALGGLDAHYFLYCEDMDLCKRMHLAGYSVVYFPEAEIEYEGTRSARYSLKYACIFLKSLLRYWKKFGISI